MPEKIKCSEFPDRVTRIFGELTHVFFGDHGRCLSFRISHHAQFHWIGNVSTHTILSSLVLRAAGPVQNSLCDLPTQQARGAEQCDENSMLLLKMGKHATNIQLSVLVVMVIETAVPVLLQGFHSIISIMVLAKTLDKARPA